MIRNVKELPHKRPTIHRTPQSRLARFRRASKTARPREAASADAATNVGTKPDGHELGQYAAETRPIRGVEGVEVNQWMRCRALRHTPGGLFDIANQPGPEDSPHTSEPEEHGLDHLPEGVAEDDAGTVEDDAQHGSPCPLGHVQGVAAEPDHHPDPRDGKERVSVPQPQVGGHRSRSEAVDRHDAGPCVPPRVLSLRSGFNAVREAYEEGKASREQHRPQVGQAVCDARPVLDARKESAEREQRRA